MKRQTRRWQRGFLNCNYKDNRGPRVTHSAFLPFQVSECFLSRSHPFSDVSSFSLLFYMWTFGILFSYQLENAKLVLVFEIISCTHSKNMCKILKSPYVSEEPLVDGYIATYSWVRVHTYKPPLMPLICFSPSSCLLSVFFACFHWSSCVISERQQSDPAISHS